MMGGPDGFVIENVYRIDNTIIQNSSFVPAYINRKDLQREA